MMYSEFGYISLGRCGYIYTQIHSPIQCICGIRGNRLSTCSISTSIISFLSSFNTQWADFGLNRIIFKTFWKFLHDTGCLMLKCEKYRLALTDRNMFVKSCLKMVLESWDLELFGMYQNHFVICILSFLSSLV